SLAYLDDRRIPDIGQGDEGFPPWSRGGVGEGLSQCADTRFVLGGWKALESIAEMLDHEGTKAGVLRHQVEFDEQIGQSVKAGSAQELDALMAENIGFIRVSDQGDHCGVILWS